MAEQMRALEGTRERMTADLGAREAALSQREDAAVAAARKREDDLRRRGAQDEQVCSASPSRLKMLALSVQRCDALRTQISSLICFAHFVSAGAGAGNGGATTGGGGAG